MSSEPDASDTLHLNERFSRLVGFVLVSAMLTCAAVSLVQLGQTLLPGWNGSYLVFLSFLLALEAMYSQRAARRLIFPEPEWVLHHGTEWVVILLVLKLAYYIVRGPGLLVADIPLWAEDFGANFFAGEYVFACFLALFMWGMGTWFSGELAALEFSEETVRNEVESGIYEPRAVVRGKLVNMILFIGIGMISFSALMHQDALTNLVNLPPMRYGVYNLLLYFLFSLVLLSLTQFNLLRVSWALERLNIRREIAERWLVYSMIFILVLAVIAGLLPTYYSIGLLSVLNYVAMIFMGLLNLLVMLIVLPLLALIGWLMQLFGASEEMPILQVQQALQPANVAAPTPIPWLDLFKSLLFWVVFLGVIVFSIHYYLKEHDDLRLALRKLPLVAGLRRFWEWLRGWMGGVNRQIGSAVDEGWQRLRTRFQRIGGTPTWQFVNLRRLTPRERVLFYYLAMVRRGGEKGLQRKPAQTPYEYSTALKEALSVASLLPEEAAKAGDVVPSSPAVVEQDIPALTERFVEARYSLHEVTAQDASLVKRYWERIRRLFRKKLESG